ncbi:YceI family protein [Persicimonas caeni]|uniref:YceI family protein n=1 Tax=Persicimonas caeni TaxID=2292766 RepID=A0A4Y6PQB5_PERCE|nr:YceI family protein [Persicimonas caeni]QDG50508.1 YceI family protein [Persicimonas caeni]QED31729.1 YceI family protein [Persicimonas caeni]
MSWNFDAAHSKIGFAVRHMMISKVRGDFKEFDVDLRLDPHNLEDSSVSVTVQVDSIDTNNADRDGHLRSADFFATDEYPTMTFESTGFRDAGDGDVEITGDLTIKGTTHEITLTGEQLGPVKSPFGGKSVGYSLTGELDREAFGLTWNQAMETGGVLVGKKVEIVVEAEVTKADEE